MPDQTTALICINGSLKEPKEMNEDNRLKKNLPFEQIKGIKLLAEKMIELRKEHSQLKEPIVFKP